MSHPKIQFFSHIDLGMGASTNQSTICPSPTATFMQPPTNTTVCLGSNATFVCSATNVMSVFYTVDSMAISNVSSRGVSVSAPTYSGNMTIRNLTILGTLVNNNSLITCLGIVSNRSPLNSSAYLSIKGQYVNNVPYQ